MGDLRELQEKFISDCLSGELTEDNISLKDAINPKRISAKGQMGIYRESAIANISLPLEMTYPVIKDLVGDNFFGMTCRKYTENQWPTSGNMNDYGEDFASFLKEFEPTKQLPYLPDIARLEWLFHKSALADDKEIGDWSKFSELSADEISNVTIDIHPSVELISSRYPLIKIWEMCKSEEEAKPLDIDKAGGANVLLVRKDLKVELYPIAENEFAFLRTLIDGKTLLEAFDAAIKIEENEDIQGFILKHITIGTFCDYTTA